MVTLRDDGRFPCSREGFAAWAEGRQMLVMEHFYRLMLCKTGLLMEGDQPAGVRCREPRSGAGQPVPARPA